MGTGGRAEELPEVLRPQSGSEGKINPQAQQEPDYANLKIRAAKSILKLTGSE